MPLYSVKGKIVWRLDRSPYCSNGYVACQSRVTAFLVQGCARVVKHTVA